MAALTTIPQQTTSATDEAVFVAQDGRRARRLRNAAVVAGVLALLWVVGLGIGMLGFGSLPGVAIVKGERQHSVPVQSAMHDPEGDAARLLAADVDVAKRQVTRTTTVRRTSLRVAKRRAVARRAVRAPSTTPPAASAQAPVNPATRTRGWSRKGYSAPRGQLRKATPPPPPATSRGRHVGPQKPLPAPPPPVPPGQAKKALEQPPPPPPKKG
jgi:hypothetical protein